MSETAHLAQMFDSTVVRAHVSAVGAKGVRQIKRSGRSRVLPIADIVCQLIKGA